MKGGTIMSKFYGENIETITPELLLLATPFTKVTRINFDNHLSVKQFFEGLYMNRYPAIDQSINYANHNFERQVSEALQVTENIFAKVDMIHIAGYAGCGKTTFVRHLLWQQYGENLFPISIVDFEGEKEIVGPLLDTISRKIYSSLSNGEKNITYLQNIDKFELRRFDTKIVKLCKAFINDVFYAAQTPTKEEIQELIKHCPITSPEKYVYYLLALDFLWNLTSYQKDQQHPFIVFFDNVDSVDDEEQEKLFVTVLKEFINDCNYFYSMNLDNENYYNGWKVADIMKQTKFVCFLTTRHVTIKKFLELAPDLEKVYGWTSLKMPETYYDHLAILNKRMEYYKFLEGEHRSRTIEFLEHLVEFSNNVYKNNNFMKLFNGSFRYSVRGLCNLVSGYIDSGLIEESNRLYNKRILIPETSDGSSGMILGILCHYLKRNGVYSDKLCLSECQPDGKISLSRIILTVLHEKGGTCNMFDLLNLLSPFFRVQEICRTVYVLNEAKRDILRRMVTFDLVFPKNENDFLQQGKHFKKGNYNLDIYSDVILCLSGEIYLDYVVPHFEFMLSRHKFGNDILSNYNYRPLFSESSEQIINDRRTGHLYGFERKIDWVYQDVQDCCNNSVQFAEKIMEYFDMDRETYLNNSYFNYHPINRDGAPGYRQSYESRLIFSQVGYIERYRRYLLCKYRQENLAQLIDINRRLVERIKRYITLYQNSTTCFQTNQQDKAAIYLQKQIAKIEQKEYEDFETKIEVF